MDADVTLSFTKIKNKILSYSNDGVFSAASCSFSFRSYPDRKRCHIFCGNHDDDADTMQAVTKNTLFDLASLTKPLVTVLSLLVLIDREDLHWHTRVKNIFPEIPAGLLADVTIESLMSHRSGLPSHRNYETMLLKCPIFRRKKLLLESILFEKINPLNLAVPVYSDLGYILLGFIVEKLTGNNLDVFWSDMIARPLGLDTNLFFPSIHHSFPSSFATTGWSSYRDIRLQGVVNDDNCRALGGVSGHAGLFGTSHAVLALCEELLALYQGKKSVLPIRNDSLRKAVYRIGHYDWSPGFCFPSATGSSSGRFFSANSFGHLGFTGTSFWIDPDRYLVVVLLTNRVCKGPDKRRIKEFRPEIHDLVGIMLKKVEKINSHNQEEYY